MNTFVTRHKSMTMIITTLAVLFLIAGSSLAQNKVTVSSPQSGEQVGSRVVVEGTVELGKDRHLWLLAHAKLLGNQWWPQPRPVIDNKGNWQALVYIGGPQDVGLDFEIAIATFDPVAEIDILNYHAIGNKTGQWLPIPFPKPNNEPIFITVRKTRH